MQYQYEILKQEVARYSASLAERNHAVAITKIDALSVEEANRLTEKFLTDIGLSPNGELLRYKADAGYLSYGVKKESWESNPKHEPVFVLPISSVGQFNTEALRYALADFASEEKKGSGEDDGE